MPSLRMDQVERFLPVDLTDSGPTRFTGHILRLSDGDVLKTRGHWVLVDNSDCKFGADLWRKADWGTDELARN